MGSSGWVRNRADGSGVEALFAGVGGSAVRAMVEACRLGAPGLARVEQRIEDVREPRRPSTGFTATVDSGDEQARGGGVQLMSGERTDPQKHHGPGWRAASPPAA